MEVKIEQDFEIFQVAEISAEETVKKEEFSDYETFNIGSTEALPREEIREVRDPRTVSFQILLVLMRSGSRLPNFFGPGPVWS